MSGGSGGTDGVSDGGENTGGLGADAAGIADTVGEGGTTTDDPITRFVPTPGCGQAPAVAGRGTIQTMGTKPADAVDRRKGDWSYEREYFVHLPGGYDQNTVYPLVLQAPGCRLSGINVIDLGNNADDTVIRIVVTPPPTVIGHPIRPIEGCFDDIEGDDSVDWVFYENLYDKLAAELCFDRNRVFASGIDSGAWFANELACKYAGDVTRPVRGVLSIDGHLPREAPYAVTCSDKPIAGMWIAEMGRGSRVPIDRAMQVNGCAGSSYATSLVDDFPIGGGNQPSVCEKVRGCPELYPLVVCAFTASGGTGNDAVANPGFATFIKLFSAAAFISR